MATQDLKVIHFETIQAKQKDAHRLTQQRLAGELRNRSSERLGELMQHLFAVIDDELFKFSDKSESMTDQSRYFEAMRYIRVESTALQAGFQKQMDERYEAFWVRPLHSLSHSPQAVQVETTGESEFELMENEALEEDLAVTSMIHKGNHLFQRELFALNKRMAWLRELEELESDGNPLGPRAISHAFSAALKPLILELPVKLLIYKLFDKVVLSALGRVYADFNESLLKEGILPNLGSSHKRSTSSCPQMGRQQPGEHEEGIAHGDTPPQSYGELFQSMQTLLDGWRGRMGVAPIFAEARGPAVDAGEVLNALNVLQHPAMAAIGAGNAAENLKEYVQEQLRKLQPGEDARSLARPEEDIIDMVALIFDYILEDRNLPDPVKALISRLQIPVVKVAILEKSFFARKNHPVRLLLNALAQAGIGLDLADGGAENPVFRQIESIVSRILDEFDRDVNLFSELLDELMASLEKEAQRSRVAEERARQVTQSKEQLQLAKRKIAYEIASRVQGQQVPAPIRSFLYNTWKDVLVLAYLRRDKEAGVWDNALDVMGKLIWTATAPTDPVTRKQVIPAIPPLLKSIRAGLESISLDPQSLTSVLKDLETCYVARLSRPRSEPGGDHHVALHPEDSVKVEIRDPELARAIVEIRANLPDIEGFSVEDLGKSTAQLGIGTEAETDDAAEDEFLIRARSMDVGEWVEMDDGRKRVRAKLSWKSQVTSTYVFVNRKGVKIADIAMGDLAARLRAGTARIIEGATVPLMDRALNALMSTLKAPA